MDKNIVKKDILRIISITYLIIFCIFKLLMLTNVFSNISINTIMFASGCLIFLIILMNKKINIKNYPILLKVFILVVIINILFNLDIETIKSGLFEIFYVFIVYNIAYTYLRDEDLTHIIKIILILSTFIILIFFVQYLLLVIQSGTINKSLITHMVFSNINGGAILGLLNIVALIYLYDKKKINRFLTIFLSAFYTIFIILSQARTSILGLIVLVLYIVYMKIFKNIKFKKIKNILEKTFIIIMAIIFILLICIILKKNYSSENEIDNTIISIEEKLADITTLRYWLWKYSLEELIDNNILFGIQADFGEDSFNNIDNEELLNSFSTSQKEILNRNNMHNGYIQILIRNGILGFGLIIIFIIKLFLKSIERETILRYYICLMLIFMVINFFENHLVLSNSFFVLFLWINIAKNVKILKERDEEDERIY